ncbi:tail fiber protein [Pectobacterium brasiliense]|uniref:phage tail protein n=1 Tax=Pectobacterium brasiliense TaxID=180957 RepID=UPI001D0CF6DC|nr:phage tail protein [Pectobacterium brasiliense]UDQ74648.1 tail fiber protein [Pectobacterium brasiliense]
MANLSEQESWIDGIYQLETSDPVVAGPGGISNRQAEQLASRTAYLKKMQEATGESLQTHLAASDPHSQYAPKNSPALTGTPTAPTTAQTANNTQIATTAFVKSAIAALINGSPAALDTLQELANALGNDPHFSTTILNAIADVKTDAANKLNAHASIVDAHPQYAPKASPAFTGTPTAPTAASGSNDTQLATTAFVKAAVAALVNGSPAALDTLQELANALGNDPNFSATVLNALAGKLAKDQNGADIPDISKFRANVGLVKQSAAWTPAESGSVIIAGLAGGVGQNRALVMPDATLAADFRINGAWYTQSNQQSDVPSNGHFLNLFSHPSGNYGLQFWGDYRASQVNYKVRAIDNNTVGDWRTYAFIDVPQTFSAMQIFKSNQTPLRILAPNAGDPVFIPFYDSNGITRKGWVGRGYTNNDTIQIANDVTGASIQLLNNGRIQLAPQSGQGAFVGNNQIWDADNLKNPLKGDDLAGIPLPFPGAVAPAGWLKCNGQQFDKAQFPVLASRYPSGVLPDLRGEFVRGWDDGRGADTGRALLSQQGDAIRNITGYLNPGGNGAYGDGALFKYDVGRQGSSGGANSDSARFTFDASKVVPTANENRPRNIAFNYIVRAA